jgi:hypothetical protein
MDTIRFTNDGTIKETGVSEASTMAYYRVVHSTFVFTRPPKNMKGSGASNIPDEEVRDEKKAVHKRLLKMKRRGMREDGGRGGRDGRGGSRGGMRQTNNFSHDGRPSLDG